MNNKTILIDQVTQLATLKNHYCPYRAPIMMQNNITGEIGYTNLPCNSHCPHFEFRAIIANNLDKQIGTITINCGAEKTSQNVFVEIIKKTIEP